MLRIIARGPAGESSRFTLRPGRALRIGRLPGDPTPDAPDALSIPWDRHISREHVIVRWERAQFVVEPTASARNPVFFQGQTRGRFTMAVGEHFVIGETTFHLIEDWTSSDTAEGPTLDLRRYSSEELRSAPFRDADLRLEVLAHLPDLLRGATDDDDLFSRLVLLLLEGIPSADAAAIVRLRPEAGENVAGVEVSYWDRRDATTREFRPSRRLIVECLHDRRQSVATAWLGRDQAEQNAEYTLNDQLDWAFCTPVPGQACAGWGLYVAGRSTNTGLVVTQGRGGEATIDMRPDLRFSELVASILGALRDLQQLEQRTALLGRFFSPIALPLLSSGDGERALEPRETPLTILVCDLRGAESERETDRLMELLGRVSRALDVMTDAVHRHQGVVGDLRGEAALAFWGWPLPSDDAATRACRAALEVRAQLAGAGDDDVLAGFRCGIGIATGPAVAGRLGSAGRFKIDVFGPVVTRASRLHAITASVRVPILIDEATFEQARTGAGVEGGRFRRLARLRQAGADAVTVYEVLPPAAPNAILGDDDVRRYEDALEAFLSGDWEESYRRLHEVPPWDHGKDLLLSHILQHGRRAPAGWDGAIVVDDRGR
jgi:adenylate cyclase